MASITCRPAVLGSILDVAIRNRLKVLITGAPGIGKSDIVAQACTRAGADLAIFHPVVSDPTDFKGLPALSADGETARFLPYGDLVRLIDAAKPTVAFLDDLGQAAPATQAAVMQLLLAREINGVRISDFVTFIAATNRRGDKASVRGILEPVKSRFDTIVELEPILDDFIAWAARSGVGNEVIAFLSFRPELLMKFEATTDMTNSPCPRTWAAVDRWVKAQPPKDAQFQVFAGAVGEGAASEFVSFLRIYRDLPNPDAVLMSPDTAPIPEEVSAMYALVAAVSERTTRTSMKRFFTYLERLHEANKGEFVALSLSLVYNRDKSLLNTLEARNAMQGPLGALLLGKSGD